MCDSQTLTKEQKKCLIYCYFAHIELLLPDRNEKWRISLVEICQKVFPWQSRI